MEIFTEKCVGVENMEADILFTADDVIGGETACTVNKQCHISVAILCYDCPLTMRVVILLLVRWISGNIWSL